MKIVQISDPHLNGNTSGLVRGVQTDESLQAVLDVAFAQLPDAAAVLVTGDIVQDDASGYARLKTLLGGLQIPVLCLPGNHDEPEALRRELSSAPFSVCEARSFGAWQIVMLDSQVPGEVGGRLSAGELARLDKVLHNSPQHALVCLHHHPVSMGSRWLDAIGLANAEDFWRIIDRHRHVRAVLWGHVHQAYDGTRAGVRLFATPSTGAQFLPHSESYAIDTAPPAFRSLELHPDGRIDSTIGWVAPLGARRAAAR